MNAQPALAAAKAFSMDAPADAESQGSTAEQWGEGPAAGPSQNDPAATPQLPEELLLMLRCITRSAQHALRSHAWLQVVNVAIQAWNVLRAVCDCAPRAITMHTGTPSYLHSMMNQAEGIFI